MLFRSVAQHGALGQARGAGGVDDRGEVVLRAARGVELRALPRGGGCETAVAVRVEIEHLHDAGLAGEIAR